MNPSTIPRPRTGAARRCKVALPLVAVALAIAGVSGPARAATAATRNDTPQDTRHPVNRCAALAREMARLDSRMRAGYGGKTGEAMRDRRREAIAEFHRLRCRGLGTR